MKQGDSSTTVVRFGLFEADLSIGELRKRGLRIKLQEQPFQILAMLLARPGEMVTREDLRLKLWPADTFVDFDHGLNKAISKLREALSEDPDTPRYIETLPRRGYRFVAPIEVASPACSVTPRGGLKSLAVLPLENLSGDADQEYFVDGMTEQLISALGKVRSLRVTSRTSAMRYKGIKKPLAEIARELNVDGVVEGAVMRSGDRVRISAQLIDAATDSHLWADNFERDLGDVLNLQSEVALAIVREIQIELRAPEQAGIAGVRRVNPEAYDAYLKGRFYWNKRVPESLKGAIEYFNRATQKDPAFAPAYSGLADCYNILGFFPIVPPGTAYPKAKAAALKALELDETLAEAHASLGRTKMEFEWDWAASERELRRAIDLDPKCLDAHHRFSHYWVVRGRVEESLAESKLALELDPMDIAISMHLGWHYFRTRQYPEAVGQLRKTLELEHDYFHAHVVLGKVYQQMAMLPEAIEEFKRAQSLSPASTEAVAVLADAYAVSGQTSLAMELIDSLRDLGRERYVSHFDLALAYSGLGQKDTVFEHLERACEDRSGQLIYLKAEPRFDPLHSDPRFQEILVRMNFPT